MKYFYQARSKEGKVETGTVEASSKEAAALLLQKYSIYVTSIKEQSLSNFNFGTISFLNKVSKKDLAIFSRQLSVMMQSRVPVTQSLKSLSVQIKNPNFKEKVLDFYGKPSETLGDFPTLIFPILNKNKEEVYSRRMT